MDEQTVTETPVPADELSADAEDFAGALDPESLETDSSGAVILTDSISETTASSAAESVNSVPAETAGTETEPQQAPAPEAVETAPASSETPVSALPERDFTAEVRELLDARPELVGQSLPQEVIRSCVESGRSLLFAYTENEARTLKARVDELTRENSILRMNAEAAERAPVRSASLMGSPEADPDDPFLMGFDE